MRIAIAQLSSSTDPAANLRLVEEYAQRAADAGAGLIVFPEATMCSFTRRSAEVAEPLDGPWAAAVRAIAARLGITVVVGMFTTAPDGRVHNTLLITGSAEASYDKIHLFDALGYQESRHIAPGSAPLRLDVDGAQVGFAICYDIRFPGHFTRLADEGATVIIVSASWAPGRDKTHQWRTLAMARAMDSTAFVVAVDQAAGGDPEAEGPPTGVGHSLVVDPTGTPLVELGRSPELAIVDIDPERADSVRLALPVVNL